jgi:hypothetical protein
MVYKEILQKIEEKRLLKDLGICEKIFTEVCKLIKDEGINFHLGLEIIIGSLLDSDEFELSDIAGLGRYITDVVILEQDEITFTAIKEIVKEFFPDCLVKYPDALIGAVDKDDFSFIKTIVKINEEYVAENFSENDTQTDDN